MTKKWLILGASPSHRSWYKHLSDDSHVTITTNDGLKCCPCPNYYWISDPKAWRAARSRVKTLKQCGTQIVTSRYLLDIVSHADVTIDLPVSRPEPHQTFNRGRYAHGRASGSIMTQFAVNNGAREVHVVGCEGWAEGTPKWAMTSDWYAPLMRSIVEQCQDVNFFFYGTMAYDISGPNVEIISTCPITL